MAIETFFVFAEEKYTAIHKIVLSKENDFTIVM